MVGKQVPKTFTESEVGILIEHFDSKLDFVAEGHVSLDKKMDKVDANVDDLRKEMDRKFDIAFDELRVIRNELKEKIGRDEFQLLEKRIAALERRSA